MRYTCIRPQAERSFFPIVCYNNSASVLPIDVDGQYGYAGFGIWPNTSTIAQTFGDWSADSFVARVLAEPNTGLFWTLLISPLEEDRGQDLSFGGILTIGEIVNLGQIFNISDDELKKDKIPDLKLVTEYPLLNNSAVCENETYYAFIDEISWGNGSATLNSSIPGTPKGKIAAYLDSLSPWNQVPYSITKELYGNLQNATYVKESGLWFFDCVELSVNITIAGHAYPISPLTVAQHFEELICVGTVSHLSTTALCIFAYPFFGSSKPSQKTLEAMSSLVFPSVRPLFGIAFLSADNCRSEERLRSLLLPDEA